MDLILQTLPQGYEEFTNVLCASVKYKYKNNRQKKFEYFQIDFKNLIQAVLETNTKNNVLTAEETEFLRFASKLFGRSENKIKFEEYYELVSKGFNALEKRIEVIKEKLLCLIDEKNLQSSETDNKYLFIIENTQKQLRNIKNEVTQKEFENRPENEKTRVVRTFITVLDNFSQVIFTISKKDFGNVEDIYLATLDIWDKNIIRLNPETKIIA